MRHAHAGMLCLNREEQCRGTLFPSMLRHATTHALDAPPGLLSNIIKLMVMIIAINLNFMWLLCHLIDCAA